MNERIVIQKKSIKGVTVYKVSMSEKRKIPQAMVCN